MENFEHKVLYHSPFIGKCCVIARPIESRFPPEVVEALQAIA